MEAIVLGDGPRSAFWLEALTANRRVAQVIRVASTGDTPGLEAAMSTHPQAVAVLADALSIAAAVSASLMGRTLFIADVAGLTGDDLARLYRAAVQGRGGVYLPRQEMFTKCERTIRSFLRSGRLGEIGHLSCIDDRTAPTPSSGISGKVHMTGSGAGLLAEICKLFDVEPVRLMARIDVDGAHSAVAQAYLDAANGICIHYSGNQCAAADARSLWIEGSKGTLRTDGALVWWRKRGWRFFLPVRLGLPARRGVDAVLERVVMPGAVEAAQRDDRVAVGVAAAALLASRQGTPVALAELTRPDEQGT